MKENFKPQLWPNKQVSPEDMDYPMMASYKLDGIRCIFKNGEMFTRSLKDVPNKQLHEKLQHLKDITADSDIILDGELYSHELTFQEIYSAVMSHDKEVPESLDFWCFDAPHLDRDAWSRRFWYVFNWWNSPFRFPKLKIVRNPQEVDEFMEEALENDFEGLILLNPKSKYKCGRITVASGDGYKLKPYRTYDAKIVGVNQATEVDPEAEKKINELGYSETSQKKEDRIPVEKAAGFEVLWDDKETLGVNLPMTDEEKEEVWKNREDYLGRWLEFRAMDVGAKDVPRPPAIFIRFREDKE